MEKFFISFLIIICFSCNENKDWNVYGGSYERTQYIDSDKINKNNISQLDKVWEYKTSCHLTPSSVIKKIFGDFTFFGIMRIKRKKRKNKIKSFFII